MSNPIVFPNVYSVACHTDNVGPRSTFVAISGMKENGANYILQAIDKGANTIVIEQNIELSNNLIEAINTKKAKLVKVANSRIALAQLSAQSLGYPAKELFIIGVTGTKGKSTTVFIIEHILKNAGFRTALISTVKNKILEQEFPACLTTPQPDYLHVFFDLCRQQNVDYVIMEVAAQALSLHRVNGLYFDAAVFTNFSLEHSEFYKTMEDYFQAKVSLFDHLKPESYVFLNSDDENVEKLSAQFNKLVSFGLSKKSNVTADIKQADLAGVIADIILPDHAICHKYLAQAPALAGKFNVYNLLAACAVAYKLNINPEAIKKALLTFNGVAGRLERFILPNGAKAFIDYAHTPSSYEAVLSMLRKESTHLIVVFGAGGDRDSLKRPLMGDIASRYADIVIITSDNPRSEDPNIIIEDIKQGIDKELRHKVYTEIDREKAIKKAYGLSSNQSIIVLLGKGPDEYQIVQGKKIPFSEATILRSF